MAYEVQNDDEEELKQQEGVPSGNNTVAAGQGSGVVAANTGAQSQAEGQGPGQFATIQKYLKANQGQGAPLAEKISGEAVGAASGARSQAEQARGAFEQNVQSQVPTVDMSLIQSFARPGEGQKGYSVRSPASQQGLAYSNPAWSVDVNAAQRAANLNAQQKEQIKKAANAHYTGPQNIEETGSLLGAYEQAQKAQNLADLSKSEPGRFELLKRTFQTPNYAQGQQRLDQAILQLDPGAKTTLDSMVGKVGNVRGDVDSQAALANQLVAPTVGNIDTQRGAVNKGLEDALAFYESQLGKGVQGISQQLQSTDSGVGNTLSHYYNTGEGRDAAIKAMGLNPNSGFDPRNYLIDPSHFLGTGGVNPTIDSTMSRGSYDDLGALSDLAGIANPHGTANPESFDKMAGFDRATYENSLRNNLTQYRNNSGVDDLVAQLGGSTDTTIGGALAQAKRMANLPTAAGSNSYGYLDKQFGRIYQDAEKKLRDEIRNARQQYSGGGISDYNPLGLANDANYRKNLISNIEQMQKVAGDLSRAQKSGVLSDSGINLAPYSSGTAPTIIDNGDGTYTRRTF